MTKRDREVDVKRRDLRVDPMTIEERAERSAEEVNAMCSEEAVEGATQAYEDCVEGHVFGDNTSSTPGNNNPGQHGRDGGETNGEDNNPSPELPEPEAPPEGSNDPQINPTRGKKEEEEIRRL